MNSLKPLDGLKILIVEDAKDIRLLLKYMVGNLGGMAKLCDDGVMALDAIQEEEYDLVLMDIKMPVMDGYEALKALRLVGFTNPIIAITAHVFDQEKKWCMDRGFSGFLPKPFDERALVEVICELTKNTSTEEESLVKSPKVLDPGIRRAYEIFYNCTEERLYKLNRCLEEHRAEDIGPISHQIKGSCACYGYVEMSIISGQLYHESEAVKPDYDKMKVLLESMKARFKDIRNDYKKDMA